MKNFIPNVGKYITDTWSAITGLGIIKIFIVIIVTAMFTIAFSPNIILRLIEKEKIEISREKKEFRKENDPIIRQALHDIIYEVGACRASVLEFHNGKENPSGLGFYYVDMNYEVTRNRIGFVSEQYTNINMSLLEMPNILYMNGYWYGTVEELKIIDPKLGHMIEENGTKWIAFLLLESSIELGILELSFTEEPVNKQYVGRQLRKTGAMVSGKLDFANRKKEKSWLKFFGI